MSNSILAFSFVLMASATSGLFMVPSAFAAPAAAAQEVKPEFEGHCAMGVCDDKFVKADPKYKLERGGKVYYFSSEASKKKFEQNFDANAVKADQRWRAF